MRRLPIAPPERGQRGKGAHRVLAGRNHPTRVSGQSKCVPPKMKEYYSTGGIADSLRAKTNWRLRKSLQIRDVAFHTVEDGFEYTHHNVRCAVGGRLAPPWMQGKITLLCQAWSISRPAVLNKSGRLATAWRSYCGSAQRRNRLHQFVDRQERRQTSSLDRLARVFRRSLGAGRRSLHLSPFV